MLDFSSLNINVFDLAIDYRVNETTISYAGNSIVIEGSHGVLQADDFIF